MEFEYPNKETTNKYILVSESNPDDISNDDVTGAGDGQGNRIVHGDASGIPGGTRRGDILHMPPPPHGRDASADGNIEGHVTNAMSSITNTVDYLSTFRDEHSASGGDFIVGPSNTDVFNSSVPYDIDRTGLNLATSSPGGDIGYHGGERDILPFVTSLNSIIENEGTYEETPVVPVNTTEPIRAPSSSKLLNKMAMSRNFFTQSQSNMGAMDRLVATLNDHDEYEELFDPLPNKV